MFDELSPNKRLKDFFNVYYARIIGETTITENQNNTENLDYHKNWIVPCNPNDYNVDGAFQKYEVLNWEQSKNYSVGDYVYIYVSTPQKRISYKAIVTKIDVPVDEVIHDEEFEINNEGYKDSKKMEIKLVGTSSDEGLIYSELKKRGLKSKLQSSEIIKPYMFEYIDSFFRGEQIMNESRINVTNKYVELLLENRNIILHGAPGTGKTHLAKEIAKEMGAKGDGSDVETGFCQFHPSYDYTDFVEGLRPNKNNGFERVDGVFKEFCKRAHKNLVESKKTKEQIEKENKWDYIINEFLNDAIDNHTVYKTIGTQNEFNISDFTENSINISIPKNESASILGLNISIVKELLQKEIPLNKVSDIRKFYDRINGQQHDSYYFVLINEIRSKSKKLAANNLLKQEKVSRKNYVFIIDEINRGELSKIFGELFFSIDAGYRGLDENGKPKGLVKTQYQNLIDEDDVFAEGFFVPENVYIIGTMNDIDRSVESMDFAMRRRFVFKEVSAKDSAVNMKITGTALSKMEAVNKEIESMPELGKAYCIGGAYFLKDGKPLPDNADFDKLWELKIGPLVYEYLRGIDDDGEKYNLIEKAYKDA